MQTEGQKHDHHERDAKRPKPQPVERSLQGPEGPAHVAVDPSAALQRALGAPPGAVNPNDILSLQRAAGNRAVQNIVARRREMASSELALQAGVSVNPDGDRHEWGADSLIERAMRPSKGVTRGQPIRRQPGEEEELQMSPLPQRQAEEDEELQTKPATNAVPDVDSEIEGRISAARGRGQYLADGVRGPLERALDADFSDVRVHTDADADGLARSLQARAFATGRDIFFKSGEYSPVSSAGQQLIAHELTHVVQQGGVGAVQRDGETAPDLVQRAKTPFEKKKEQYAKFAEKQKKHVAQWKRPKPEARARKAAPYVPVRWYKTWWEVEKERRKHAEAALMNRGELTGKEMGGRPGRWARTRLPGLKKKSPYARILDKLDEYHGAEAGSVERASALLELRGLIGRWRRAYQGWSRKAQKAKAGRKRAIAELAQQIEGVEKLRQLTTAKTLHVEKKKGRRVGGSALEALDRKEHREASVLGSLYPKWQAAIAGGDTRLGFFDWVDDLESQKDEKVLLPLLWKVHNDTKNPWGVKEKDFEKWKGMFLQQKQQRNEKLIERIEYVKEPRRAELGVTFAGGQATKGGQGLRGWHIFAMSPDGSFYIAKESGKTQRTFHHSSFLAGAAVGAGGNIMFDGPRVAVSPFSGHYRPGLQQMLNAVHELQKKGVALGNIDVAPFYEESAAAMKFVKANELLAGIRAMKRLQRGEHGLSGLIDAVTRERDKALVADVLGMKGMGSFIDFLDQSCSVERLHALAEVTP